MDCAESQGHMGHGKLLQMQDLYEVHPLLLHVYLVYNHSQCSEALSAPG